jgi:hypothetical protein
MTDQKPSVGRIVHYVSYGTPGGEYGSECRAAVVTEVTQAEVNEQDPAGDGVFRDTVGLCVLNPEGLFLKRGLLQDEDGRAGGTWHWPERV